MVAEPSIYRDPHSRSQEMVQATMIWILRLYHLCDFPDDDVL